MRGKITIFSSWDMEFKLASIEFFLHFNLFEKAQYLSPSIIEVSPGSFQNFFPDWNIMSFFIYVFVDKE